MVGKTLRHPAPAPSAIVGAGGIVWVDYAKAVGIALWCLPAQYSVHRKNFYMSGFYVWLLRLSLLLALFLIKLANGVSPRRACWAAGDVCVFPNRA